MLALEIFGKKILISSKITPKHEISKKLILAENIVFISNNFLGAITSHGHIYHLYKGSCYLYCC